MYNIVNRHGVVLASVGAYVTAQSMATWFFRHGQAVSIRGAVK